MAPQLFLDLAALVGGTVLTMGSSPTEPITAKIATILIDGQEIVAVGTDLELPPGTVQHDITGLFVMPGLIDGFTQFDGDHDALYTSAGVTTVRDVGGDRARLLELRRVRDTVPGPRLLTAGVVLGGDPAASPEAAIFRTPEDAERLLPLLFADQVDFLSVYPNMPADAWKRTIELGVENSLATWGPTGPSVGMDMNALLDAGQRGFFYLDALLPAGVEWDVVQPVAFKKSITKLVDADVGLVPMLRATGARLDPDRGAEVDQAEYFQYLGAHYRSWWQSEKSFRLGLAKENETFLATGRRVLDKQETVLKMLFDAGVKLAPGSGAPHPWLMPGAGLVEELLLWEAAGLPRDGILYSATKGAAQLFSIAGSRGEIAAGKTADLVVLRADPRLAIANLKRPAMVVMRGDVLSQAKISEMLALHAAQIAAQVLEEEAPMEVLEPVVPEGDIVLKGFVENRVRDTRISAERWAVVREPDGGIAYCGRLVTPSTGSFRGTDMNVVQHVKDGALTAFELTLLQGSDRLVCNGKWVAERFQIERRLNNVFVDNRRTDERAITLDVGSITSALVLGQRVKNGIMPVLKMHESFEPEVVAWQMEFAEEGMHLVRTSTGGLVFGFDAKGAPTRHDMRSQEYVSMIKILDTSALGGPGFPTPAKPVTLSSETEPAGPK